MSASRTRAPALLLAFWLLSTTFAVGQTARTPNPALDARIPHFELKNGDILQGLSILSTQNVTLVLGFERVLKPKRSDPPVPESVFSLNLENTSVREILDALCNGSARYVWSQDGTFVNVFPKAIVGEEKHFLNRRLKRLQFTNIASADAALGPLAQQLGPTEQIAIMQLGGSIEYTQPWTATLENLTVRQVLNRIAAQLGPKAGWVFTGSEEFHYFTFYTGDFHTASTGTHN